MAELTRYRGDTFADTFTIFDNTTGLPVDLTGASLLLTVDPSATPVSSATNAYQIVGVIATPSSGVVSFAPTLSQSNRVGYFYYDIQLTDITGKIRTVDNGVQQYKQDITK